jgi:hypothetical protein
MIRQSVSGSAKKLMRSFSNLERGRMQNPIPTRSGFDARAQLSQPVPRHQITKAGTVREALPIGFNHIK